MRIREEPLAPTKVAHLEQLGDSDVNTMSIVTYKSLPGVFYTKKNVDFQMNLLKIGI